MLKGDYRRESERARERESERARERERESARARMCKGTVETGCLCVFPIAIYLNLRQADIGMQIDWCSIV